MWLLKLDNNGNVQWQKTYGGPGSNSGGSVMQVQDGGYIVAGYTSPSDILSSDFWVLKLDSSGDIPGCSSGVISNVAVNDTNVTGNNTNATVLETSFSPVATVTVEADTDATASLACGAVPMFADVPFQHWANSFVTALAYSGITGGCSVNPPQFCPDQPVTRGQMAVFIIASLGRQPIACSDRFADVPFDHPFCGFIEKLAADGITGGCGDNTFCPDASVTRGQMAVFIEAALGNSANPCTDQFADVSSDNPFCGFIERLAADGITGGCGGGNFCPNNPVTRAEMAVFLVAAPDPLRP